MNIDAFRETVKNLKNKLKTIVEISEKSYNFKGFHFKNEGFGAQQNVSLKNIEGLFSKFGISSNFSVSNLVFVLANSGDGMLNGNDYEDFLDALAVNISSFLFDDVMVSFEEEVANISRVHFLNLNDVYVPLSIYLEKVYFALLNASKDL